MPVAGSQGTVSENISHFTAIRMRVYGSASLQLRLLSLDEVKTQILVPVPVIPLNNREPTRLCNFNEQRASLEIKTTEKDEKFTITRILVFARPLFTDYPA